MVQSLRTGHGLFLAVVARHMSTTTSTRQRGSHNLLGGLNLQPIELHTSGQTSNILVSRLGG